MKFDTYSDYDPRATSQTLPAFLTVWPGLGNYHDDLVLLGGMESAIAAFAAEAAAGNPAMPDARRALEIHSTDESIVQPQSIEPVGHRSQRTEIR